MVAVTALDCRKCRVKYGVVLLVYAALATIASRTSLLSVCNVATDGRKKDQTVIASTIKSGAKAPGSDFL